LYASDNENVTRRLRQRLLYFFLPSPCLACSEPVFEPRDSLGLCPNCRERLVRWPIQSCSVCGCGLQGVDLPTGYRCGGCRKHAPPYDRALSAWAYQPPLDAVLMGLKFQRLEYLGGHLARLMAPLLRSEIGSVDMVVPIPLHWSRYLKRGYNQAAAIAKPLAVELGLPVVSGLRRRRSTPPQTRLSRSSRQSNLRRAFAVRRTVLEPGARVLLVDDVLTTGTTLATAAASLRQAGASSVTVVAAARTPEDSIKQREP